MPCKAPYDLPLTLIVHFISNYFPDPILCPVMLAFSLSINHTKHTSSFQVLFPLPGVLSPQIVTCFSLSLPSGLHSNITFSVMYSLIILSKSVSSAQREKRDTPSSSVLLHFFLCSTCHHLIYHLISNVLLIDWSAYYLSILKWPGFAYFLLCSVLCPQHILGVHKAYNQRIKELSKRSFDEWCYDLLFAIFSINDSSTRREMSFKKKREQAREVCGRTGLFWVNKLWKGEGDT